ncbi:MAG: hypothetical protein P4L41_12200 [Flavipsychrobacter sp.]|nr:hypothetical protein [Flavipsychrobacter sp.]
MIKTLKTLTLGILIVSSLQAGAKETNHLKECWDKQVKPIKEKHLAFTYQEKLNELYHSSEPWQQMYYTGSGAIWCNAHDFAQQDTFLIRKHTQYSKTQFNEDELLFQDYGDKDISPVTHSMFSGEIIKTARYTPVLLINYFLKEKIAEGKETDDQFAVYKTVINETVVKLYIRKADDLLVKATALDNDELRGDVLSTFIYMGYTNMGGLYYPKTIQIEKVNSKVIDEVAITSANKVKHAPFLLEKPAGYTIKEDIEPQKQIKVEKYNDHIYFMDVMPAGAKIMLVEFSDFLLVAEAPRNSQNGELIIKEANNIAPGKPIKYFAFGHHHPDYLGGMRAFIHKGATVLSVKDDKDYVTYLASAPHTLKPDSLYIQPMPLKMEEVKDSTTITDGTYKMKMYVIGKQSGHTKDYLIYYFPQEKLVFEDDLVWIQKTGPAKKAGETQAGLYKAMSDLNLDVQTIIQSWGISYDNYKTVIPITDMIESMSIK